MINETEIRCFRLARMSPLNLGLTLALLALPVAFLIASFLGARMLTAPGLLMMVLYAWVWLRLRPKQFIVHQDRLDILWPLKRVQIPRTDISSVRLISRENLKNEISRGVRIGAGGLWGSFGWLWTRRRGVIQMYVSRTDNFVWIECAGARPWLITPEQPEAFVRALSR